MSRAMLLTVSFLALSCGRAAAQFPVHWYTDAEQLAVEFSDALLPPPDLVASIDADLAAIRQVNPQVASVHVWPDWVPGQLLIRLDDDAWWQYLLGQYHGFDALNALYLLSGVDVLLPRWLVLGFCYPYNPTVLGPIYGEADGVVRADPNSIAGDGDDILCEQLGAYTFRRAWGNDCMMGCEYSHYWDYQVQDGAVTLLQEYGEPIPAAGYSCTWGALKASFR